MCADVNCGYLLAVVSIFRRSFQPHDWGVIFIFSLFQLVVLLHGTNESLDRAKNALQHYIDYG